MMLKILIEGRQRYTAPFDPQRIRETARALDELLPSLRELGRTVVFVNDDTNVAHIVAR